ncbi:hypothetical protein CRE_06359 [Caenorhabditis remanei]|uniref:Uncharacterized protein n=2 Tax=Caenorhabditis remanei TaxID=31234 RepID=E3M1P8_CAERE|nr:hypothetical protein CRE_06359 [Caenorhabditis remanei]
MSTSGNADKKVIRVRKSPVNLLLKLKTITEEAEKLSINLNTLQKCLMESVDVEENDDFACFSNPYRHPNYLWSFAIRVWYRAGFVTPSESENIILTQEMIERLLKVTMEVSFEAFSGPYGLRDIHSKIMRDREYGNMKLCQILTIVEKFTEVMMVKKEKDRMTSATVATQTADEAEISDDSELSEFVDCFKKFFVSTSQE